ncbi:MAG TPA: hypothetical protein VF589_08780 [Allosphingosinicella sp.]|jgi:ElaB/YqjD/DUF883 family membrane-anchored ribosome-binding protein
MPPRNPELPEGTDHIVNGAMETGAGTSASTGSSGDAFGGATAGGGTTGAAGGGASSGFIGGGEAAGLGDGTGGTAFGGGTGGGGGGDFGGGSGGSGGGTPVKQQLRQSAQTLKGQATDKVRSYADDGKQRATSALDDFAQVVNETAQTIDERLGAEYGEYARRAAGSISDFSARLRDKEVDELFDDARNVVRKSPALAIGTAAALGFALVRLIKSGMPEEERDVQFTPDSTGTAGTGAGTQPQAPVVGTPSGTGV